MMTRFKRIATAVVAALALHLLLLAALKPGKQRSNDRQPLQVSLLRSEPAKNLQHPTAERADAAASKHPGTVPARRKTARRERPDLSEPVLPGRQGTSPAKGSPQLSLVLKRPLSLPDPGTEERGARPAKQKSRAEDIAEEETTVERRIESWVTDAKAAQRVEVPDVYWREAATVLEEGFRPGPDILEHGAANAPAAPSRTSNLPPGSNSLNGDFFALPNEARGLESVSLSGAPRSSIDLMSVVGLLAARNRHRLTTLVSVAHAEDGAISAVRLVLGSGNAAHDKLALKKALLLGRLRHREPGACQSVWAFETEVTGLVTKTASSHVRLAALY